MNNIATSPYESTPGRVPSVAVVTGAASGIGLASARALAERGTGIVGVDLADRPDELAGVADWVRGDVAEASTWARAKAAARELAPDGADCLVACAATIVVAPFLETPIEEWRRLNEVNVLGAVRGIQTLAPAMTERGDGAIVVVCSVNSHVAEDSMGAYSTSKAALLHATRSAAIELAAGGVRVNAVCPGIVDTPLLRRHLASLADPEAALAAAVRRSPIGRLMRPEDVAAAVCFLAGAEAAGLAGAAVTVDGGLIATYDFDAGAG